MTDTHSTEQASTVQQMKPYFIVAAIIFVIILIVFLWPSSSSPKKETVEVPISKPAIKDEGSNIIPSSSSNQPDDDFALVPAPQPVELAPVETPEPQIAPLPEPEPLDVSDGAVKTALLNAVTSPVFSHLLVNDGLIQRFVVSVNSLAEKELSPNNRLVEAPAKSFEVYQQADRKWIDANSFQRYSPYVQALESIKTDNLLNLLDEYRPAIEEKFAEISQPGSSFDSALIDAINLLLDTPEVPVPIEVYSDSVMFKFKDERIEALSAPQKQLLRTGPDNMRRIKVVLRELKKELQDR